MCNSINFSHSVLCELVYIKMLDIDKHNFNGYENVFIKFAKINFITVTKHPNLKRRQLPIHTSFQIVGWGFFFYSIRTKCSMKWLVGTSKLLSRYNWW